jgi:hypothetical protein
MRSCTREQLTLTIGKPFVVKVPMSLVPFRSAALESAPTTSVQLRPSDLTGGTTIPTIEDDRQSTQVVDLSETKLSDPFDDPRRRTALGVRCRETVVQAIAVTARDSKRPSVVPLTEWWSPCRSEDL